MKPGLDKGEVFGVHPLAPEIRRLEIFLRAVAEEALDVLADEGRREVAMGLEAVDDGRGAFKQAVESLPRVRFGLLGRFAGVDIAPRTHHLEGLAVGVSHEGLLVVHPAIRAVLAPEAVFAGVPPFGEEAAHFRLDPREVVGMDMAAPEIGVVEIVLRGVAEEPGDVLADIGRRKIALGLEAVDDGGRGIEQARKPRARRSPGPGFGGGLLGLASGGGHGRGRVARCGIPDGRPIFSVPLAPVNWIAQGGPGRAKQA